MSYRISNKVVSIVCLSLVALACKTLLGIVLLSGIGHKRFLAETHAHSMSFVGGRLIRCHGSWGCIWVGLLVINCWFNWLKLEGWHLQSCFCVFIFFDKEHVVSVLSFLVEADTSSKTEYASDDQETISPREEVQVRPREPVSVVGLYAKDESHHHCYHAWKKKALLASPSIYLPVV